MVEPAPRQVKSQAIAAVPLPFSHMCLVIAAIPSLLTSKDLSRTRGTTDSMKLLMNPHCKEHKTFIVAESSKTAFVAGASPQLQLRPSIPKNAARGSRPDTEHQISGARLTDHYHSENLRKVWNEAVCAELVAMQDDDRRWIFLKSCKLVP